MRLSRIAGVAVLVAVFTGAAAPAKAQIDLTGITIPPGGVTVNNGVLTIVGATLEGTLAGLPFTTNITNFQLSPGGICSVLDLELAPIHIALLGLHVDTSAICLTITAQQGVGLGSLLCSLVGPGGLLGGILDVGAITNILNSPDFLSGLSTVLNQALGQAQRAPAGGSVCTGRCTVLDVVLGPLTLTLLGVTVDLNNCSNGPVEVCVSATRSEGLLGSILCGLAHNPNLTLQGLLSFIENLLGHLGLP